MKNANVSILFLGLGFLFFTGCSQTESKKETATESTQMHDESDKDHVHAASYTCPMHPEVKSDKPGKCPKCGMDLVKSEADQSEMSDSSAQVH